MVSLIAGGGGLRIQALERSQPVLPMRPAKPEGHTPEYYRHGSTSLFAALDVKTGKILGRCYPRHRAKEFLAFLRNIETHVAGEVAAGKEVHLVLNNYAAHKSSTAMKWLVKRPHWHLHFTPTHASWLNQVERFFALDHQRSDPERQLHECGKTRHRDPGISRCS